MIKIKKYKILYIVSTLKDCGPINQLYGLLKNLRKEFEAKILTLSPEEKNSRYKDFLDLNISIDSLNISRYKMFILRAKKLVEKIEKIDSNLIHTSGYRADMFVFNYLKNYNHCSTIRNYTFEDYPSKYGNLIGLYMAYKHTALFSKIKYPISCSHSIKEKYEKKHNIETSVIHNGIDEEYYKPVSYKEKKRLREKLDLPLDKKIFVFSGSLIERKDPITLIKSFKKSNLYKEAILLLLGDGPLYQRCKELKEENIFLKGYVSSVVEYLQSSDIFISSSRSEGLPNSVLEALGIGLPVILSDIGPHKEIINLNSNIGNLFPVGDIESLSSYMRSSLSYNFKDIYYISRKILEDNFSAKNMSESYQKKYKEILDSK